MIPLQNSKTPTCRNASQGLFDYIWNGNYAMKCLMLPIYMNLPIKHKAIICEPLLGPIDFHGWLSPSAYATSPINGDAQRCEQVTVGGESGSEARACDYAWVLGIREQCIAANVPFHFKQTGAHFRKDGRLYNIPRNQQMKQAHKAGIDYAYK